MHQTPESRSFQKISRKEQCFTPHSAESRPFSAIQQGCNMYREYIEKTIGLLREVTGLEDVMITDGGDHADLASTVSFALAKTQRKNPAQIAGELVAAISARPDAKGIEVSAKGPYINFVFGGEY